MMNRRPTILLLLAALTVAPSVRAQTIKDLNARIHEKVDRFQGSVSLSAENLRTGARYDLRGSEPVRTASTIKLPIMVECFFEQRRASWIGANRSS